MKKTLNISANLVQKFSKHEKWCLDKLTLNGNLPLDIIEVTEIEIEKYLVKEDKVLEVSGNRYYKINKDGSSKFPTRLVSNGGLYSFNTGSKEENAKLLEKAGMLKHEKCQETSLTISWMMR